MCLLNVTQVSPLYITCPLHRGSAGMVTSVDPWLVYMQYLKNLTYCSLGNDLIPKNVVKATL